MIWPGVATLALAVAAVLLRPLWRRAPAVVLDADLAFHRDQLAELERDLQLGTLTAAQADSARIEVQRRLLAAASPSPHRGEGRGEGAARPAASPPPPPPPPGGGGFGSRLAFP